MYVLIHMTGSLLTLINSFLLAFPAEKNPQMFHVAFVVCFIIQHACVLWFGFSLLKRVGFVPDAL